MGRGLRQLSPRAKLHCLRAAEAWPGARDRALALLPLYARTRITEIRLLRPQAAQADPPGPVIPGQEPLPAGDRPAGPAPGRATGASACTVPMSVPLVRYSQKSRWSRPRPQAVPLLVRWLPYRRKPAPFRGRQPGIIRPTPPAQARSRSACSRRHAARGTRASTRRSRRQAAIRPVIVMRTPPWRCSANWTA